MHSGGLQCTDPGVQCCAEGEDLARNPSLQSCGPHASRVVAPCQVIKMNDGLLQTAIGEHRVAGRMKPNPEAVNQPTT
jgi:hypothetical protein